MATVTKMVRSWDGPTNVSNAEVSDVQNSGAVVQGLPQVLVGLRLELSPSLVRESGAGHKLFVMIPPGVKTVRAFKNHLATRVLKTPTPFYFYDGEYRISDEEDIRIFALLTEPCRVLPVPQPKSVLSASTSSAICTNSNFLSIGATSTPLVRGDESRGSPHRRTSSGASKRVKFSDEFECSDISGLLHSEPMRDELDNQDQEDQVDPVDKKKKKRHRRHKKNKNSSEEQKESAETEEIVEKTKSGTKRKLNCDKEGVVPAEPSTVPAYDADESEIDHSQPTENGMATNGELVENGVDAKNKSEFLSPNTVFSQNRYRPVRTSISGQLSKVKAVNGHNNTVSFSSSGYGSSLEEVESTTSDGKRQDTPMLPKILKNPSATYELVKKSLNFENGDEQTEEEIKEENLEDKENVPMSISIVSNSRAVKSADEIEVGVQICFKVVELDENYTPAVSKEKIAEVIGKEGQVLSLKYIRNEKKVRSGILEIEDEDMEGEDLDEQKERNFADLIDPSVIVINDA